MIVLTSIGMVVVHAMRVNMAVTVVTILDVTPYDKVGTDQARASVSNYVIFHNNNANLLNGVYVPNFVYTLI